MVIGATEFLRRFCLHILPPGYRKIRHYGFLANTNRAMLQVQQKEMSIAAVVVIKKDWKTIAREKMNYDADQCPCCKKGRMITILHFDANAPPPVWVLKKQQRRRTQQHRDFFLIQKSKGDGIVRIQEMNAN